MIKISLGISTATFLIVIQMIITALTYWLSMNLALTGTVIVSMIIVALVYYLKTQNVPIPNVSGGTTLTKKVQLAVSHATIVIAVQVIVLILQSLLAANLEVSIALIVSIIFTVLAFLMSQTPTPVTPPEPIISMREPYEYKDTSEPEPTPEPEPTIKPKTRKRRTTRA
jgi:hypothetical protein